MENPTKGHPKMVKAKIERGKGRSQDPNAQIAS